ncbi:hypothetical protein DBV15_02992 [Temnothorax longispinosus]|uniref:Uncharacterized protein n=1 Tax=Temnothorax longispinosus TaxID=300112 RepID=A0A4S2KCH2_9HYME|nr:hypothetical protein DBV15_02992 [Temnothorax longispinosus]
MLSKAYTCRPDYETSTSFVSRFACEGGTPPATACNIVKPQESLREVKGQILTPAAGSVRPCPLGKNDIVRRTLVSARERQRRLAATCPKVAAIIQRGSRSDSIQFALLAGGCWDILRVESRRAGDVARQDEARESERASEGATGYRIHAACNLRRRGDGGGGSEFCSLARFDSSTLRTLVKATTAIDSQDRSGKTLRVVKDLACSAADSEFSPVPVPEQAGKKKQKKKKKRRGWHAARRTRGSFSPRPGILHSLRLQEPQTRASIWASASRHLSLPHPLASARSLVAAPPPPWEAGSFSVALYARHLGLVINLELGRSTTNLSFFARLLAPSFDKVFSPQNFKTNFTSSRRKCVKGKT